MEMTIMRHTIHKNRIRFPTFLKLKMEQGAALAEYALLILFIALAVVAALGPLGTTVSTFFTGVPALLGG
jgi:Flp pilus assembly pilin Flp